VPKRTLTFPVLLVVGVAIAGVALGEPGVKAQAVVDRARLDQKLRRVNDALSSAKDRAPHNDKVMLELLEEARAQLEQARAQLASERSAEVWLSEQVESRPDARMGDADAGIPPVRDRDAFGMRTALDAKPPPAAKAFPPGMDPLGEVGIRTLINAMRGEDFRGGKLRVLARAAPAYAFTVAQIIELTGEVKAPSDRLEALQLMVPHLSDRENLPILYRACATDSERALVQRLTASP
jgi:hypothetical protein